jgi:SAM-dependent methyltransferase
MSSKPASKNASKTDLVRAFYTQHPYPSYAATLKTKAAAFYRKYCETPGRFLEAGCGTGHVLVGTALSLPHLEYWAIDLSEESLRIATALARQHGARIRFQSHNLMEPLPFDTTFRYISCLGVLHHLEQPEKGLRHLAQRLDPDGFLFLHVYGEDYHRRRFQIEEMLDLISLGETDPRARFRLFQNYAEHARKQRRGSLLRRLYRLSLRDVVHGVRRLAQRRRESETDEWALHSWREELETPVYSERWLDQFFHPNERSYNLRELCEFLGSAGLEPVEMFSLGKFRPEHLPNEWAERFERLDPVSRYRLMELLHPSPTSPFVAARKKQ